jgi:hypothetical protein
MLALTLYFNKSFDFMTPSIKVTAALIILGVFNILIYASCIIKKKLIGALSFNETETSFKHRYIF